MSTCPENDIHSVYLDNELPVHYVEKYEKHVATCPACQAQLQKLRKLRAAVQSDSTSICLTSSDMEQSYDRLLSRLSYTKTTRKHSGPVLQLPSTVKYILSGAAAAAVIAIILPVRIQDSVSASLVATQPTQNAVTVSNAQSFTPVARTSAVPQKHQRLVVDGEITPSTLSSVLGSQSASFVVYPATESFDETAVYPIRIGTPEGIQTVSDETMQKTSLSSYDMFMEIPEHAEQSKQKGMVLHIYSPFASLSLEIGNGN